MPPSAPSDDAAKLRIISHMNADHTDSVVRYAEYYSKLSRFASRNARLTDVTLEKLALSAGGQTYTILLQPPMKSLSEARVRLVEMDQKTISGLDRSPVTLKEYRAPTGLPAAVFVVCLGTYLLLSRRANMLPGSLLYDHLLVHAPTFTSFARKTRDLVLWPMLAIHFTEVYYMTKTLTKHSVPLFSRLWWTWIGSCFIEGLNSFQRIAAIEKEKLAKEEKH